MSTCASIVGISDEFKIDIDNNIVNIEDLKHKILQKKNIYMYDNLKLFQNGKILNDNIEIDSLKSTDFSLAIIPIKCDQH